MADEFDRFWNMYGGSHADLCDGTRNKGPKSKALESWKKNVSDPGVVILAMEAQVRYDKAKKAKGKWVPRWPMVATWLNQRRWDCEIESHEELNAISQEVKTCAIEGCNEVTHGPRFKLCSNHLARSGQAWEEDKVRLGQQLLAIHRQEGENWTTASQRWWRDEGRKAIKRKLIGKRTRGSRPSSMR